VNIGDRRCTNKQVAARVISMGCCHAKEFRKFSRRFPEAFGDEAG
jgi:hypothetical protein